MRGTRNVTRRGRRPALRRRDLMPPPPPSFEGRFWPLVRRGGADACWLWTGAVTRDGLAKVRTPLGTLLAHRVAWALVRGDLPPYVILRRECPHPRCVNPRHRRWERAKNAKRKLDPDAVRAIRRAARHGARTVELAARYRVSAGTIRRVIREVIWRDAG